MNVVAVNLTRVFRVPHHACELFLFRACGCRSEIASLLRGHLLKQSMPQTVCLLFRARCFRVQSACKKQDVRLDFASSGVLLAC